MPERDAEPEDAAPDAPPCVEVDPGEQTATLELDIESRLLMADVFFLVDCTGSMRGEIENIQRSLSGTIVPGALRQIPDVQLGVGALSDFPVGEYSVPGDLPFELRRAITSDVAAVQLAIDSLPRWDGGDPPEAQVEALYEVATGEGLEPYIPPAPGCPRGGSGYPCFREDAQPVVVVVTDAPFHNGPGGTDPYVGIAPAPREFDDAVDVLNRLGARVVGIDSGEARESLETVARLTGSVDGDGEPLVFTISPTGVGLDLEVVRAFEVLAREVPLDVDAIVVDVAGDDLDATVLVERVVATRADPSTGVSRIEGDTFYGVRPGTRLEFVIEIRIDTIPVPPTTRLYPVVVRARANGGVVLREQLIYIEVPGLDGGDLC